MKDFFLKYASVLITSIVAWLSPIAPLLIATGFLVSSDLFTGIWAAKKKGQVISSKRMGNSVTKTILYLFAIILGHVMDTNFMNLGIAKIVSLTICIVEFKSNMENISTITGLNIWKAIKDKIDAIRTPKN
jgi:phage-related holin